MTRWMLDGGRLRTLEEVHASFIDSGLAPEHYGSNLDALFDVLTTVSAEVYLRNLPAVRMMERGSDLLSLLVDAAVVNPQLVLVWNAPVEQT